MAGSTASTKGLIFVNQSDTQPQRGGFKHSNKKSQQHWMLTEPSQQQDFTAINNYNCSSLFASIYFHRSVDTIMSETRGLWCYFASANLLWACNNFITPGTKCVISKNVCAKWFHFLILDSRHFLLFSSFFFHCSFPFYFLIVFFLYLLHSFLPS